MNFFVPQIDICVTLFDSANQNDYPTAPFLPSSQQLNNLRKATAYWKQHFANKTYQFTVQQRNKPPKTIVVRFDNTNHAYTEATTAEAKKYNHLREFDQRRAKAMQHIFSLIESPRSVLVSLGNELLIDGLVNGEHYVVALRWNGRLYDFYSAHFKREQQINQIKQNQMIERRNYRDYDKSPLTKK